MQEGWLIFRHSVWMVFSNFSSAIRIAIPLIVATLLAVVTLGSDFFFPDPLAMQSLWLSMLFLWVLQIFAGLWTAVAWHRFILLEEGSGALPPLHIGEMVSYFLRGLLIGLIVFIPAFVLGMIAGFIGAFFSVSSGGLNEDFFALLLGLIVGLPCLIIFYRLSPILPAAAISKKMGAREAWAETKGKTMAILVAAILLYAIIFGVTYVIEAIFGTSGVLPSIFAAVLQLVAGILGLSILTTLYGITIEGRALRD